MAGQRITGPATLFYSYVREDEALCGQLEKHLALLQHQGLLLTWHKYMVTPGEDRKQAIDEHLEAASIILLLISADFLASDYYYGQEMKRALERQEAGEARVIPVILRPCDWHTAPFGSLQVLPQNGQPITLWNNRDEAFLQVSHGLRALITQSTLMSKAHGYLDPQRNRPSAPEMVSGSLQEPAKRQKHQGRFFLTAIVLVVGIFLAFLFIPGINRIASVPLLSSPSHTASSSNGTLYQADWSKSADHWPFTRDWQWQSTDGGTMESQRNTSNQVILAPFRPSSPDYTIEAQIKRLGYGNGSGVGLAYGLVVRYTDLVGYVCGTGEHDPSEHHFLGTIKHHPNYYGLSDFYDWTPPPVRLTNGWHLYRVEVKAMTMTLYIDHQLIKQETNITSQNGQIGIYIDHASIALKSFVVLPG